VSARAEQLHATAGAQIDELLARMATLDETALRLRAPAGRKLGDGTGESVRVRRGRDQHRPV
jgi:hypothetical protein